MATRGSHKHKRRSSRSGDWRRSALGAQVSALPVSAGDRKRFDWGSWGCGRPGFGCACSLPPIAAGSASGRTGQGPGGSPVGVAGAVGVLDAAAWELIMPAVGAGSRRVRRVEVSGSGVLPSCAGDLAVDRPGQEEGQPALPGCSGLGRCPGDKMIDWLSPPWGVRPLSLIRPPARPLLRAQRPAAADSGSRELAAVVPSSGACGCGIPARPACHRGLVTMEL